MASLTPLSGRLSFRCDSGEMINGRVVYRTVSLGEIDGDVTVEKLGAVAAEVVFLLALTVDRVTFTRSDVMDI